MQKREWHIEVLRRLGWTQTEIGEAVGLKQPGVRKALLPIPDSVKVIKTQIAKTRQIEEVAAAYNMPLVLASRAGPTADNGRKIFRAHQFRTGGTEQRHPADGVNVQHPAQTARQWGKSGQMP